jgi:tRNA-uridine 2-sulfurtransferase
MSEQRERIVVAMSGGVDSAVAAARLVDQGFDVIGVTLHLWDYPDDPDARGGHGRCCAPEDQYDAKRVADALGFPHYTFDRRELFAAQVVQPFVEGYLAGSTPSPCTTCNRTVKLLELFHIADRLGARKLATGHYARLVAADGTLRLARGVDTHKDQSYFLYATPTWQLERLVFPLGNSHKGEVRAEAVARGLPGATKGESQELCFVGQGARAYVDFVESRGKERLRPGPIVDAAGNVIGNHEGIHRFTIGQRKGLGVAVGKPAFVTNIAADTGTVTLGDEGDLAAVSVELSEVHLAENVTLPLSASARVRYRHEAVPAEIRVQNGSTRLTFHDDVRAATKGQIAVFYQGDQVLGGARIERVFAKEKAQARPDDAAGNLSSAGGGAS